MTKKRQIIEKIISSKVYDIAQVTPIDKASNLSKSLKNNIFLKREDLQPTHSFKVRGSYNKIEHLYRKKNVQHVVTASAGNHAQGVALAAKHLKIKIYLSMDRTKFPRFIFLNLIHEGTVADTLRRITHTIITIGNPFGK